MSDFELFPPIQALEFTSGVSSGADLLSATYRIWDAAGQVFSLVVQTEEYHGNAYDAVEPGETLEPVLVLPETSISPDVLETELGRLVATNALATYLVPQYQDIE